MVVILVNSEIWGCPPLPQSNYLVKIGKNQAGCRATIPLKIASIFNDTVAPKLIGPVVRVRLARVLYTPYQKLRGPTEASEQSSLIIR